MKTIRVSTENSNWTTSANGTQEELNDYFLNHWFDVGVYPVEKMEQCVKVEVLNTYLASFDACKLGAIGLRESFKDIECVRAVEEQARIALYDNFERIQCLKLQKV